MKKSAFILFSLLTVTATLAQNLPDWTKQSCEDNVSFTLHDEFRDWNCVFLDFYYTTCGPCNAAIPSIEAIYNAWGGENSTNLRVFGMNGINENCSAINAHADEYNKTYPDFSNGSNEFYFYDDLVGGSGGFPLFVIIKPDAANPEQSQIIYSQMGWSGVWQEQAMRDALADAGCFPLGISTTTEDGGVTVFPNPATTEFTISLEKDAEVTVELFNTVGQQVATLFEGSVYGRKDIKVSTSNYAAGVYFVQVKEAGNAETMKVNIIR